MHPRARDALEAIGVAFALPLLGRSGPGRHLILAYHNVVPDDYAVEGDPSVHLPISAFRHQLDLVTETHQLVSLDRILTSELENRDRLASVTFDDAYRGALRFALPELRARGVPATVFVAPGLLGTSAFWWDALVRRGSKALEDDTREYALNALSGDGVEIEEWADKTGRPFRTSSEWERPGTLYELQRVVDHPLVALGSHSWSHPNLTRVDEARLVEEIERPLAWLRENFSECAKPVFAYPYGLSSPPVESAVRRSGYEAALRVQGGLVPRRVGDRFKLPRVNVPAGLSARGFKLRAAGMLAR